MTDFVKVFNDPDFGQVAVMLDTNDEGQPSLFIIGKPQGFGLCKAGLSYEDSIEGEEKAEAAFEQITEEIALRIYRERVMDFVKEFEGGVSDVAGMQK